MRKKLIAIAWAFIIGVPCILTFSSGEDAPAHETIGWTNILGFAWMAFLALGGWNLLTAKWMRDELNALFGEEED